MNEYYDPTTHQPITQAQAWAKLPPQNKALLSPQEVASKTGLWVLSRVPTPEGYVAIGPTLYAEYPELQMAEAYRDTITQAEYDAQQQAAEHARIQAIAANEGAQQALTILNALLLTVGLSIPVSEAEAVQHVMGLMASGDIPPSSGIAGNLQGAWQVALQYMGRADVPSVWEVMNEA
jgi:hypothetical protein